MKKLVLVLLLAALMSAGAFAQHPDGWGVGLGFSFGGNWRESGTDSGLTLYLKAPKLPIYWGINANLFDWEFGNPSFFGFRVTGDYLFIDRALVPDAKLGWFLGVGGYVGFWRYSFDSAWVDYSYSLFDVGVRVPVGLYWMPLDFLEVFLDIAPSLGFYNRSVSGTGLESRSGLGGGWQGDFGIRFWL